MNIGCGTHAYTVQVLGGESRDWNVFFKMASIYKKEPTEYLDLCYTFNICHLRSRETTFKGSEVDHTVNIFKDLLSQAHTKV